MLKIKLENFHNLLKQKRCDFIYLNIQNLLRLYEKKTFYKN